MPRLVTIGWQSKDKCIVHKELLVSWHYWGKLWCCINYIKRCPRLRSGTILTINSAGECARPEEKPIIGECCENDSVARTRHSIMWISYKPTGKNVVRIVKPSQRERPLKPEDNINHSSGWPWTKIWSSICSDISDGAGRVTAPTIVAMIVKAPRIWSRLGSIGWIRWDHSPLSNTMMTSEPVLGGIFLGRI